MNGADTRRKRTKAVALGAAATVVAVTVLSLAMMKPFGSREPFRAMTIPPADAAVTDVADSYLSALAAQHCAIARALALRTTPAAWCADPELLSYHRDGATVVIPGPPGGSTQTCVPYLIDTTQSSDHSMPAGVKPWSLCFTRTPQGWRLSDQGHL
jgi:hypothetical protein